MRKKKRLTEREFKLLLSFLTDKNEGTLSLVKDQLKTAIKFNPRFRNAALHINDPALRHHAEMFLEEMRYQELQPAFQRLFDQGDDLNLEKGLFLLASVEYPELTLKDISAPLDRMAKAVDKMISKEDPQPTRPVHAMRKYLFDQGKFRGNEENYYDPDNSYLNKVLEKKTGIPITLSCLYLLVAWRLNLLVHGVGLPGHFIVGHRVPRGVTYIDAFNRGRILRIKDCEVLVRRLGMVFKQEYLDPASNGHILSRMIVNLINIYNDRGATARAHWLAQLFQLLQ